MARPVESEKKAGMVVVVLRLVLCDSVVPKK